MNEIRDLILGIDLGKEKTQLCYFDRRASEPRALSMKAGANIYEAPTCLCYRADQDEFTAGLEADYFARERDGELIENLYGISGSTKSVQVGGKEMSPESLLEQFLKGMLRYLGVMDVIRNTKCLCITVPELTDIRVRNLKEACRRAGFADEQFMLIDYGESFYYYVMTQKKEVVSRSVGWYIFDEDHVTFRKMTMNTAKKPFLVRLEDPVETDLPSSDRERDSVFCQFIQKTLGTELYSSIQISGEGFSTDWALQAVKILCFQKRKVYYGNNLHAGGACQAAKERTEDNSLRFARFVSDALITTDVGMDMLVMGSRAYVPMITNGSKWYECSAEYELILDQMEDLVFSVNSMGDTEKKRVVMRLPGLPKRPPKTTRLLLSLSYISPRQCRITVKDLGFGEMFPSSGKVWKETVDWEEENE